VLASSLDLIELAPLLFGQYLPNVLIDLLVDNSHPGKGLIEYRVKSGAIAFENLVNFLELLG